MISLQANVSERTKKLNNKIVEWKLKKKKFGKNYTLVLVCHLHIGILFNNEIILNYAAIWIVLIVTLLFIVVYGSWKTKGSKVEDFILGNNETPWYTVGLSVMAAS
jgi:hypothetical protein